MLLDERIEKIQTEMEELSIQLADMLGVALFYAGVPNEKIHKAVEAYLDTYDKMFGEEGGSYEDVIVVIEYLKRNRPSLFK
ncbi:MAG: hypothetical protein GXO61_04470 [Epsilonproteobacteria bacterium]|nr:hypothetical protein [Campylobacterota bacterium]